MAPLTEPEVEGSAIVRTSLTIYHSIRCNFPKELSIWHHRCENFKPRSAIIWDSKEGNIFRYWI